MSFTTRTKFTGKYEVELTWILDDTEIAALRSHVAAGTNCEFWKNIDCEPWGMAFDSDREKSGNTYAYLRAIPTLSDLRSSSSTEAWAREGNFSYKFTLIGHQKDSGAPDETNGKVSFSSKGATWGRPFHSTAKQWISALKTGQPLGFSCAISSTNQAIEQTPPANALLTKLFDDRNCADVVIAVGGDKTSRHIFALRSLLVSASEHFAACLGSGFSEATSQKALDVDTLASGPLKGPPSDCSLGQDLTPFFQVANPLARGDGEPVSKKAKISGGRITRSATKKTFAVIEIDGISFHTYRAMISYLHTNVVPFLPVASNFLVELAKPDRAENDPFHNFKSSPGAWLHKTFKELPEQYHWNGVDPCSPHEMYRLADCYSLYDLRQLSLAFIVRSLTVENCAYELFGTLSLDYNAVQEAVLKYFTENWKDVKQTKGWEIVFGKFGAGELAAGTELMMKVWQSTAKE